MRGGGEHSRLNRALQGAAALGGVLFAAAVLLWATGGKAIAFALLYTAVPMMTVALIGAAAGRPRRGMILLLAPFRSRTLRFFGDISYWVYLIHVFSLYEFAAWLLRHVPRLAMQGRLLWLVVTVTVLALSVLSGVAVRHWIELPALRRKSRFR